MHATKYHRDRDAAPIPTDIADKITAMKRKAARYVPSIPPTSFTADSLFTSTARTKDRTERPPVSVPHPPTSPPRRQPPMPPVPPLSRQEPDPSEFNRILKLSPSSKPIPPHKHQPKLYNPATDPIPMRRTTEPEPLSESTGNSYPPRPHADPTRTRDASQHRQLFDPQKHDPVSFSTAQARKPAPKHSGDYASVSSASSYATSVVSSDFTLSSSTTGGSSAPSSLFDNHKPREESKTSAFSAQLKKLYRDISALETKILADSGEPQDESRIVIKGGPSIGAEDAEKARWKKATDDHKKYVSLFLSNLHGLIKYTCSLSELMLRLLEISLAPGVPASLRNIPEKYNIIIRLWTNCFYRLLENLRRSSLNSKIALEYLQEFIYYAYTFYTALLERETFLDYRPGWLEALGDLARYRIVIAAMVPTQIRPSRTLTAAAVRSRLGASSDRSSMSISRTLSSASSEKRPVRPDSPSPSVGIVAARLMELEPEKDRWRRVARDWYAEGVAGTPGHGKLHHHLGLLSREAEGEELRGVYHFVKR
jgi:protein SMG6